MTFESKFHNFPTGTFTVGCKIVTVLLGFPSERANNAQAFPCHDVICIFQVSPIKMACIPLSVSVFVLMELSGLVWVIGAATDSMFYIGRLHFKFFNSEASKCVCFPQGSITK